MEVGKCSHPSLGGTPWTEVPATAPWFTAPEVLPEPRLVPQARAMKGGMPKVNDARKALSHQFELVCLGTLAGVTWLTVAVATLSADDTVAVVSAKPVNTICGSVLPRSAAPTTTPANPFPASLRSPVFAPTTIALSHVRLCRATRRVAARTTTAPSHRLPAARGLIPSTSVCPCRNAPGCGQRPAKTRIDPYLDADTIADGPVR